MTSFGNHINTANQIVDHNKEVKSHFATVESVKENYPMQCLLDGGKGQSLSKEESREVYMIIIVLLHTLLLSTQDQIQGIQTFFSCQTFQGL